MLILLKYIPLIAALLLLLTCCQAQQSFPFVIPWDDAATTLTDVSRLNPAPLDETRRVVVKDGHFYDKTGRRVRFLGTNFTFTANFPNKTDAEKVAARMRKYGFNMVRLHHMDFFKAPNGIFANVPGWQTLDKDQMDRLDYLLYQFRRHGIYVDLNLHVSRRATAEDGFPDADKLPNLGKVVSYFEPRFIQMQKDFARDILTRYNPYSKTRYADDPTIALVEITNEDTLLGEAWGDTIANLPPHYKGELTRQWNVYLARKYASTEAVKKAWGGGKPLGDNLLRNARFQNGNADWTLEVNQPPARAEMAVVQVPAEGTNPPGSAARLRTLQVGTQNWHLQFHQTGLDFQPGQTYTVQFQARADAPRRIPVYTGLDIAPWRNVGLQSSVALETNWKKFTLTFTAGAPEPKHNRLTFVLGDSVGEIWLADLSIRPGILVDIPAGESLETRSLSLPPNPSATPQGVDYVAFLIDVEQRYAVSMKEYIQKTLKSQSLVTCSQASYGGPGGVWRESLMDWVDMHSYWQHPAFPPGKDWSPTEWTVNNVSMVRDFERGGTLPHLAMHRVQGKPFTVSEYNHPAPNDYRAEGLMMLAAYAAWQDWDGIFLFDYNGSRDDWNASRVKGFFSVDTDPARIALMPAAAMIFLRGDLQSEPHFRYTLVFPSSQVAQQTARYGNNMSGMWVSINVRDREIIESPVAVQLDPNAEKVAAKVETFDYIKEPDHAIRWKTGDLFEVRSPRSQALIGFLGGSKVELNRWTVEMQKTARNFAVFSLSAMDNKPTTESRSLLLSVVGSVENVGMKWNAARNSVSDQWGTGPTLAEPISARITLWTNSKVNIVYALDGTGKRVRTVPSQLQGNSLTFSIGPEYKTLWYEIAVR